MEGRKRGRREVIMTGREGNEAVRKEEDGERQD
jgi:hypothetical protein